MSFPAKISTPNRRFSELTFTLRNAIEECKNMKELKQIHTQIITSPNISRNHHNFIITRILFFSALSDSGSLSYATNLFRLIKNPDLYVYNIMIRAYASKTTETNYSDSCQSLKLYKQMLCSGITPDCLTFPFLLKECTRRLDVRVGGGIYGHVIRFGFCSDLFVQNSMISLFMTCGFVSSAGKLFDKMFNRDVVSWNAMIIGYLRSGDLDAALDLFRRMKKRNIFSWNSIITGFVQGGRTKEAVEFFEEMLSLSGDDVVRPDKITIASVLSACANLGAIDHGNWVHNYLRRSGLECDVVIGTALVNMYGKCGCVERAYAVFKEMPKKDTLAWTAMISVFALHGYGKEAFDTFEEMESEGVAPNHVTFVGLLSACAHSGFVEKGRWCFEMMRHVYLMEPQVHHYACMVDILSRAGLFDDAEGLIRVMPMEPDVFVWGALLGGCQMHGNVELGEKVALYLIDLDPLNHAFYMNLCDIYAKAGRYDDVKRIRVLMKERSIRKEIPGCSLVEVDGVVHEFCVRGSPDVVTEELVWLLNQISKMMKNEGSVHYVRDLSMEAQMS
ncbi:pentatricopeptide repeat-containing protein At5g66520-like [Pistacia vera]|uniref:pentatricopeptide repeat-containing protein At5g66520-like n=1 Tax=Pistacia vera TaxID=55513 RepID=UPI001262E249|nr:pentatricopeptide repeat-containing protein At5g66520-like [Pistacia vera]